MKGFGVIVCGLFLVSTVAGYCFRDKIHTEMTVSKRVRFYCEFKPTKDHVIKLLPGSKLFLADQCLDCSCTSDGLQCCGFGRHAGVVALPDNCVAINDGCHSLDVSSINKSKNCANESIDFDSLSKTLPHPDNAYAIRKSYGGGPFMPKFHMPNLQLGLKSRLNDLLTAMLTGNNMGKTGSIQGSITGSVMGNMGGVTGTGNGQVMRDGPSVPNVLDQQTMFVPEAVYPYQSSYHQSDLLLPWLMFM